VARKLTGGMPPGWDLPHGFSIRLTAVDANTGALVSGVNVSGVAIMAVSVTPATADDGGVPALEPLFIPLPVGDL